MVGMAVATMVLSTAAMNVAMMQAANTSERRAATCGGGMASAGTR
jgi:hypothetical protein